MKICIMTVCVILSVVLTAAAETYRWTDAQGGLHYTDSLESVPAKLRQKVVTEPDITIRDPKIKEEARQREERIRQEEASRPQVITKPDNVPAPAPLEIAPAAKPSDDLQSPRTKSQRIKDNLERRNDQEEKNPSSGQPHY
ncbi:MAG: DUF4124 domain-containing protein [Desulfuromonadales bacterium]|nr:DUF4124 domain-containing protein [Desulfuromonadales bacterium]